MKSLSRFISTLGCGLALGVILGACEKEPDWEAYCADKVNFTAGCGGFPSECEDSPCYKDCTELGESAEDFSAACGALWIEVYECFITMECEDIDAWRTAQNSDTFDYPCGKLESEFRDACPDVPLYSPMN